MKVIVCGGRDFADDKLLFSTLDRLHKQTPITLIIHGAARGADALAGTWAILRDVPMTMYAANWLLYGKAAGPIRNRQMLEEKPDLVVAMPGGRGTADMVRAAREAGVSVLEVDRP